ncbi:cation diffusion facilitator family transporter [Sandaracinus amylolyticus]|uniref:cation diffusion facilitator family transporter n=1 Tax=Sandaracinus amylolyticus TaxID=927083 RepID=UPI001F37A8C3|nr:cation diffusion facilitator family transporter [Sandaracinus amylolyticus]UJR80008.1 Cobalt-zinc-cadmium resistance protein CzcD [Sandaracinus amylolyticus]
MRSTPARALGIAFALTASFMIVEAVGGVISNSLALLSDAGHMLSDAGALALALAAQRMAERPRTRERTFGFRRAETLAALANAAALAASAVLVVVEALRRLAEPQEVAGGWMLGVATVGLAVNLASAWVLSRGRTNVNVRAALAHVLADAAGSVAAMAAGAAVAWLGWTWADAASSLLISVLIALASWRLVRAATRVLMEAAPAGLDVHELERTIRETRGVADVHDLHAWRIEEGFDAVTVHVVLMPGAHGVEVAAEVSSRIHEVHGIQHVTVQPEAPSRESELVPVSALTRRASRP